jgi:Flp pilus assembly CpaE family ATPase
MNSGLSQNLDTKFPDSAGTELLSIALIGPDEERRKTVAKALADGRGVDIREFSSYPPALDDVPRLLEQYYDVIMIDLDSNPEYALELVENICAKDSATVMVYSALANRDLVFRCMRAGVREYLTPPFDQNTMAEALDRAAAVVRPKTRPTKKTRGKMMVFLGAKGGSGVTTIACNFAIALAQESGQSTLLIDLALPMGDAALNLGIAAEYSTDNALQDAERLDASFLNKLLVKHQSGVSLLAAPSKVPEVEASKEAIDKLMAVARQEFDNVIVDVGSRIDLMATALFKEAYTIYLVTQAGISELRNSNRLISRFFNEGGPKLEVVINRFEPSFLGVTEELITKALSRPVRWKIPDDYDATRQMQNSATPLSLDDSPISRLILEMASSVTGHPISSPEKKKGFSFKGFGRSITEKIATPDKPAVVAGATPAIAGTAPTVEWSTPEQIACGTPLGPDQLNAMASVAGTFVYTPGPGYVLPAGTHSLWVTFTPSDTADDSPLQASVTISVSRATPAIKWPAPSIMNYGAALSSAQLRATASVPGSFVYTPAAGEVLSAGEHTLSVTFTPTNAANYTAAQTTASVVVAKATPIVSWPTPDRITCGSALSSAELNATASVPGTFSYIPTEGEVLGAGEHALSVIFTPTDTANYATAEATVSVSVSRATPVIAWPAPEPIVFGTELSAAQLAATASVPGTFAYTPAEGAVLAAGEHTPSLLFTPADASEFTEMQTAVSLTVLKATPAIAWPNPDPVSCGSALGPVQLNATASVPGSFAYTPAAGEILASGPHTLSVTFTPADTMNYTTAHATVPLTIAEISPVRITWLAPAYISYGDPLSDHELNAAAPVPGTFAYAPSAGVVLPPGKHTLSATFTPDDARKYATAQATVALFVEGLPDIASLLKTATQPSFAQTATADSTGRAEAKREVETNSTPIQKAVRETRTYKGATYEKGEDGQWHLQQK